VIGSGVGGILGAFLYVWLVETHDQAPLLWLTFAMIGVVTIIGLLLYNRFILPRAK
jgi:proton-dependent oligopeptide transporter, POT family